MDKYIRAYVKNPCLYDFQYGDIPNLAGLDPNKYDGKGSKDIPSGNLIIYVDWRNLAELLNKLYFLKGWYVILVECADHSIQNPSYIPYNVCRIYTTNLDIRNPLIEYFPFGILPSQWNGIQRSNKIVSREHKVLVSFSTTTYEYRKLYFENINKLPQEYRVGSYPMNLNEYFDMLWTCKYVACPRGGGIDTYRKYEALYSGAIPIVQPNLLNDLSIFPCIYTDKDFNITMESIDRQTKKLLYCDNTMLHCEFWRKKFEKEFPLTKAGDSGRITVSG